MDDETPPRSAFSSPPGELIAGRYQLERCLGEGNMGSVWRARDVLMHRHVALKRLHRSGAEATRMLEREMRALARLQHPNLVTVFDTGVSEGAPYFAMELVPGTTLAEVLEHSGALSIERALRIASQIARGLGAAHEAGVVHRDLKPSNIMLGDVYDEHDRVKLVDFGVARLVDGTQESLSGGLFVGTPHYSSPEQAQGQEATPASDLYCLGVTLYEMLTGQPPFDGDTALGLLFQHVNSVPAPPSRARSELPEWLEALVLSLLEKEPRARPGSARELLACLSEQRRAEPAAALHDADALAPPLPIGSTLLAPTVPTVPTAPASPRRLPRQLAARPWLLVLLALLLPGSIGVLLLRSAREHKQEAADRQAYEASLAYIAEPLPAPACPVERREDLSAVARAAQAFAPGAAGPAEAISVLAPVAESSVLRWRLLARAQIALGGLSEARHAAESAVRACPTDAAAAHALGSVEQRLGNDDAATEAYQRALTLDPERDTSRFNLGLVWLKRRNPDAALATFAQIAERNPSHPRLDFVEARAHLLSGDRASAIASLGHAVQRDPTDSEAFVLLAKLQTQTGGDGREAYCQARALGVRDPDVLAGCSED